MSTPMLRILYSEDDPDSRELMCLMLESQGFDLICPDTPEDVLRVAQEEKFDVYLLDTWSPGMSGLELCKKIREFDNDTPIIFFSAATFERDQDEALAAGAQAYITKQACLDEVVETIRSALSSPVADSLHRLERRKADRRRPPPVSEQEIVSQFCRIPDGQRVFVESIRFAQEGGSTRAVYLYVEGPHVGQRGNCVTSDLELLGRTIPVQGETNEPNL